ncbi:transcriptional regulator with XRE-family HTH domain [Flavobacterium sp. CG_9.1]|uniref:helix-turn-helix domain-containing protein n=1 Tax=Flavobacterium sp. CG_9.1 TaxID=2787728 RepID=UPI0018CB6C32|nr:helix-turn-helix transcriptional regulator [Flavobacterium sp. CG_9.1]MBG6062900.1 transcriptional regulator with XRE-family HTH domain [Flavobacterium sp. CG_9.1]
MINETTKSAFLLKFGKKLGEIKKLKNLSYRTIAKNCDLDASFISKIEKGTENITLETILNLSYGLNIQPKEFFDFKVDLEKE